MDSEEGRDVAATETEVGDDPGTESGVEAGGQVEGAGDQGAGENAETTPSSSGDGLPELEAPFSIEDVPAELRPHVEALDRQYKSRFTEKTQSVAEKARELEEMASIWAQLQDPEKGAQALSELAERFGYEEVPAETDEGTGDADDPYANVDPKVAEELRALREADQARTQREQEENREKQVEILHSHIESGLTELRERKGGLDEDAEKVVVLTALNNPKANGLPDVELGRARLESIEAAAVARFVQARKDDPPSPGDSGSSGVSRPDTSTREGRVARGVQVADRHYVRT